MIPLIASAPIGAALLALVVAVIVGLHLWRPRPMRRVVASTLLWERAAKQAGIRQEPWRWWLALALALAIGVACVVALTRPEVQGFGDGTRRTVVLLDNSPTLATRTRDGQTRWQHAQSVARGVILGAPGPVMIVDAMGTASSTGFGTRDEALAAMERIEVASAGVPRPPGLPDGRDIEVHVVGDGVAGIDLPEDAIVHSVFEPADNVAVLRLAVHPSPADPLQVEAFVEVFNASPAPRSVRLTLRGGERFSITQSLAMAPGERVDATFDISGFEGGVLAAAARTPGDALPGDDIAYAVVDPHRTKRVLLVTRGNVALSDSLAALPGVRVEVVDPARYRPRAGFDAFVFDGFAPPQPPNGGALLFRPPDVSWLPRADRAVGGVAVAPEAARGAQAAGVPWHAVSVRRTALWSRVPEGVTRLVGVDAGALLITGRTGVPWTATGFLPGDTDLPLRADFPVFLGNVLAHLTATEVVRTEPLGPIRVPLPRAEIRDGRGDLVPTHGIPGATLFEAVRPDIYTARGPDGVIRIATAVLDPRSADVNRSRFVGAEGPTETRGALPIERWGLLVFAVLLLLLIDWAAFTRRIVR